MKIAIANYVKCPNCAEHRFDDWHLEKTLCEGTGMVKIEGRMRCHGCGQFFHLTQYDDVFHCVQDGKKPKVKELTA